MDLLFLKKFAIFKELSQAELKIFSSKLKLEKFKADDFIIKEGNLDDKLFILNKGKVCISKKMSMIDDQEKIDKTFVVLDDSQYIFFGEIGLLGAQKRTANCQAKTDCEVLSIRHKEFMTICQEYPQIGFKVLFEICLKLSKNLEKTNDDALKLTTALVYALKG